MFPISTLCMLLLSAARPHTIGVSLVFILGDTHNFTLSSPQSINLSTTNPLYLDVLDNFGNVLQYIELIECASFSQGH